MTEISDFREVMIKLYFSSFRLLLPWSWSNTGIGCPWRYLHLQDIQNPTGCSPEQVAVASLAWARVRQENLQRCPFTIMWFFIWILLKFHPFGTLSRKNNGCSHTTLLITEFLPQTGYKNLIQREFYFSGCYLVSNFVWKEALFNMEFTLRCLLHTL